MAAQKGARRGDAGADTVLAWARELDPEVRFVQPPGSTQYIPVIAVADVADIQRTKGLSEYE